VDRRGPAHIGADGLFSLTPKLNPKFQDPKFLDDDDDNENEPNARNFLSESGGVAVLDDLPIKDDDDVQDAMDDFNFLDSENTGDWNPNTQVIDKKKEELVLVCN
jgi:hypothetical protein